VVLPIILITCHPHERGGGSKPANFLPNFLVSVSLLCRIDYQAGTAEEKAPIPASSRRFASSPGRPARETLGTMANWLLYGWKRQEPFALPQLCKARGKKV